MAKKLTPEDFIVLVQSNKGNCVGCFFNTRKTDCTISGYYLDLSIAVAQELVEDGQCINRIFKRKKK